MDISHVLEELDGLWEEMFHCSYRLEGNKLIENRTKQNIAELQQRVKEIILANQGLLLEELDFEIRIIRAYGDLWEVPEEMTREDVNGIRFSVAWHTVLSLH